MDIWNHLTVWYFSVFEKNTWNRITEHYFQTYRRRCPRGVMIKSMDCGFVVSEFEPHSLYYVQSLGGNTPQSTSCTAIYLPSWKLSKLDELDMQDTAREARTSSLGIFLNGPPHMAEQKQGDQLETTYSSYVRIRDVALKTCQRRWTIGRSGDRGSGISMLVARHDDDDDVHFWRNAPGKGILNLPARGKTVLLQSC